MYKLPTFFGIALCFGTLVLWLGSIKTKRFQHIRRNDYSFGIYIYHWPIIQMLRSLLPPIGAIPLLLAAMAIVIPLAMLSWHYVEVPAMAYAKKLASRISGDV